MGLLLIHIFFNHIPDRRRFESQLPLGHASNPVLLQEHGITARWDEETCQNYGEYQSGDSFIQVWLEDAESIRVKLNIMQKYGVVVYQ